MNAGQRPQFLRVERGTKKLRVLNSSVRRRSYDFCALRTKNPERSAQVWQPHATARFGLTNAGRRAECYDSVRRASDLGRRTKCLGFRGAPSVLNAVTNVYTEYFRPSRSAPGARRVVCFDGGFSLLACDMRLTGRPPGARSFRAMPKIEPHNRDTNGDPAPAFATDAEIEMAERLRHQLEEQRVAPPAAPPPPRARASDGH